MFVLANTAGASAVTPTSSKTTLFVDASGVPSTKDSGGTVVQLLSGPAAAAAYQPLNANLTGISSVAVANDQALVYTGGAWASYSLTAGGRALSGVAGTANTFPYFSAANVVTLGVIGTTGLASLAAANATAGRAAISAADDAAVVHLTGNETIGGTKTFSNTLQVDANVQILGGASAAARFIRIGSGRTADGPSYLDFISGTVNADYDFRFYRDTGVNGMSTFSHRGTGPLVFNGIDGTTLTFRTNSADRFSILPSAGGVRTHVNFIPNSDNALDVGQPAARFRTYYGVNSAINTSDARLKTEPRQLRDAEFKAASAIARLPAVWKWLNRVHGDENCEPEGKEARKHFGPTVQAAIAVMEANGLDPFAYSFICYDEWEAEPATYDDEGNELTPAREAGDRYSFRKEELLCFMVAALAAENDLQAAKVEALAARLAALEAKA